MGFFGLGNVPLKAGGEVFFLVFFMFFKLYYSYDTITTPF